MCDKERKVVISKSNKPKVKGFSNKRYKIVKKMIFYLILE